MLALLRSLSARILLAFTALIITFVTTTFLIVKFMNEVGNEIAVIRTGDIPLSSITKELSRKQEDLDKYIADEITNEPTPHRAVMRMTAFRAARERLLGQVNDVLASMANFPNHHTSRVARSREMFDALRAAVAAEDGKFTALLAAPPIDPDSNDGEDSTDVPKDAAHAQAITALAGLRATERDITDRSNQLARNQDSDVKAITLNLERNEDRLRSYTIFLGAIAVFVGILVSAWVTFGLRPLLRLRDGARRIAAGDYGSRIDENGPTEVATVAHEFNVMGQAVEERQREVVRSERLAAVGKMAAMITHEVRNPLSSIALNTELLQEELGALPSPAEAQELCRAITHEIDRLTAITEEYLSFARLPKPTLATEQLNDLVTALASFVREELSTRNIELSLQLAAGLPVVRVDAGQVRQCLLNLVRNAAEALRDQGGGRVTITTAQPTANDVTIAIHDNGPGIDKEVRARLFDSFFSTKQGGTGLGLPLTLQIVRDHGGEMRVDSEPGHGATFTMPIDGARASTSFTSASI